MTGFRMVLSLSLGASWLFSAAPVTINRDIRPILAKNCFSCHGQDEKKTLKLWIEQGANYEKHWAFIKPKNQRVPKVAANPIDAFLQQRLAKEGLKPRACGQPRNTCTPDSLGSYWPAALP